MQPSQAGGAFLHPVGVAMRAAGRCAVITGAASGLGAAAAHRLAAEGARVVIADLDGERAMTMARQIDPGGRRVVGTACDIAREEDNERMVREAEAFFDAPIDLFVANAGVGFSGSLLDASSAQIRRTVEVNVTGSLLSAQAALRSMVRGPSSCLIFTGSLQSVLARPQRSAYTASKHAIVGMVKALALELGPRGVRVNAVAPTATDTPFLRAQWATTGHGVVSHLQAAQQALPLGRLPDPEDYAQAVLFLASEHAKSITGHTLMLDCGASAGRM